MKQQTISKFCMTNLYSFHFLEETVFRSPFFLSNAVGDDFVNEMLTLGLGDSIELLVDFPLVEQSADRHKPYLRFCPMQKGYAVKNQPGKCLFVTYPTCVFFPASSSLSTYRLVPSCIASIMASL